MTDLRVTAGNDAAHVDRGAPFEFLFDGTPVKSYDGETIGAALVAAGVLTFRTTRQNGKPRGIFCGIGICYDCLLIVDGNPNIRACVTPAKAGMNVRVQHGSAEEAYDGGY
ncbi:MAG: (2Fe-2S)-binding protein [Chloroflexota bacterium]